MLRNKIKCHSIGNTYQNPHFFILSKGRNAGKPLVQYCANCFVFIADTDQEKWHFYNLCEALWQGKYFHPLLIGSVIEFIRIDEFTMALHHANITVSQKLDEYNNYINQFKTLNQHRDNLMAQIKLIHQVKQAMFYKMLKT